MPFYLSEIIGDGSDSEGNEFRPAVDLHTDSWTCLADGRANPTAAGGKMLVRATHVPAFDTDPRIQLLSRSLLPVHGIPDDGEVDDALVRKVVRRFKVRQLLARDDLPALSLTIGDIPPARRLRIRNRLQAHGVDFSGIKSATTVANALRSLLPQIKVRIAPGKARPSGTFTDNFNGEASNVDPASHTPSGGTAWTRVDGTANMAQVTTGNLLRINTASGTGAMYLCDDQGSTDHYVQYVVKTANVSGYATNRATDNANYIGVRSRGGPAKMQIFKDVAGSFTKLGSNGATSVAVGDTIRMESDSTDAHEAFLNGANQIGPVTDTSHNTVTRQGLLPRSSGTVDWMDDYEAGVLAVAATNFPAAFATGL